MKTEDGPWVLLPSKQYPDEVYYYNVTTGESSWEKPENYCEPVDDSTSLQALTKPSTPERAEKNSYIVESLSPNVSPKNHGSQPALEKEEGKNKEDKIDKFHVQRERNKLKNHPYKNDAGSKGISLKDTNTMGKHQYNEKIMISGLHGPVQRFCGPVRKKDTASGNGGNLALGNKPSSSWETVQSYSLSVGRYGQKKGLDFNKNNAYPYPNLNFVKDSEKSESGWRETSDDPVTYGSASLRLERLRKQLVEERNNKYQHSISDLPENNSQKKWQTQIIRQRSSLDGEYRHFTGSSLLSSPDLRKSNFSGSWSARKVDSFLRPYSYNSLSRESHQLSVSNQIGKPNSFMDSFHPKYASKSTFPVTKYFDSFSKNICNDTFQPRPTFLPKPYFEHGSHQFRHSTELGTKMLTNPRVSGNITTPYGRNVLHKYSFPDTEFKRQNFGNDKNKMLDYERNSFLKPGMISYPRTKSVDPFIPHRQVREEIYPKSVQYGGSSFEYGRNSVSKTTFSHILNTPALDRSQQFRHSLLQANALKKEIPGNYSYLPSLKQPYIGSFASASDQHLSGRSVDEKRFRNVKRDYNFAKNDTKPINNSCYDEMSSKYSPVSRNEGQDLRKDGNLKSGSWISEGLVRDYNHKRVSDTCVENRELSCNILNAPYSRRNAKFNILNEDQRVKTEIASNILEQTTKPESFKFGQLTSYKRCNNEEEEEKVQFVKPDLTVKDFRRSEKETKHRGDIIVGAGSKNYSTGLNAQTKSKECHKNEVYEVLEKSPPKKNTKSKVHESKGGITKINRKVQKQLRTVAPRIKLSSTTIFDPKVCDLSVKRKKNQATKPPIIKKEEEEEMDWEPIEPEKVVLHVEALRKEGGLQNAMNPELIDLCNINTDISSQWFVVLDTNVMLSHLGFLYELRDIEDQELGMPTLFIPWIVLQELDNLKSSNKKVPLQYYARKAVNFLYENLSSRHPRVRGQPKAEVNKLDSLQPDDCILQCALNLQKRSNKVLLLTNDRNLFNKAVVNEVECCSAAKLLQELENRRSGAVLSSSLPSPANETKSHIRVAVETIKQCLQLVLEEVLRTEMVLVYDRKWCEIVARKPPWSLNDVLFCILKHWIAVFSLVLPSAARELVEKIRMFVNNEMYEVSYENVESIVKTCISLMHLVSSLSYKQYVEKALNTLNGVLQTLKEQTQLNSVGSVSTHTSVASNNLDDECSIISSNTLPSISNSASVTSSKGTHQSKCQGSGIGSNDDYGDRSNVGQVDADDDCLSLFASSLSEDNTNIYSVEACIEKGQELTHRHLNKIWEKVAVYCGMLCDVMGVEPCVPYERPDPFPALEVLHENMLYCVKCVTSLLQCMEGILCKKSTELQETSPVLLNFYTNIREYLPDWNEVGEPLLPQHLLAYCSKLETRQQLECGRKQFEQFQTVLKQGIAFFMKQ